MSKTIYMEAPNGEVFATSNPEYHTECVRVKYADRQDYARRELRKLVKPNHKVYCVLRSVSRSGMMREISLFIFSKGELRNIDYLASDAMGCSRGKQGLKAQGCGMDMGFNLVYNLGRALWPKGTSKPHGSRNGVPDSDGGYALNHEWL
jgi:hypothetical protein